MVAVAQPAPAGGIGRKAQQRHLTAVRMPAQSQIKKRIPLYIISVLQCVGRMGGVNHIIRAAHLGGHVLIVGLTPIAIVRGAQGDGILPAAQRQRAVKQRGDAFCLHGGAQRVYIAVRTVMIADDCAHGQARVQRRHDVPEFQAVGCVLAVIPAQQDDIGFQGVETRRQVVYARRIQQRAVMDIRGVGQLQPAQRSWDVRGADLVPLQPQLARRVDWIQPAPGTQRGHQDAQPRGRMGSLCGRFHGRISSFPIIE